MLRAVSAFGGGRNAVTASYPSLRIDDVRAAIDYAAELARERVIPVGATGT
jgi:uncharacterized protein (DUF433 family)